jgi:WD40 repeat protein
MKTSLFKIWSLIMVLALLSSCNDNMEDVSDDMELTFEEMESNWVRLSLLHSDAIEVMQPNTGTVHGTVTGNLTADSRYYTSNSGRYLVAIDRAAGTIKFFDSGVEFHIDHGHEHSPKWLDLELNTVLPTHFGTSLGHMVIFNDGDGSITHINEAQLEIPTYTPVTYQFENTVAHHGAGFRLENGQFVTTFKNNNEPGGLPQMVKFVNSNGTVVDDNGGVEVGVIHGDASNGHYGIFGSSDGVILVSDEGSIELIPNSDGLNSESGNWLGTLKGHDNSEMFFARSRNVGVFMINPETKSMTKIYAGNDVVGDMFSFDGEYFIVHTSDNRVRVFDAHDGAEVNSRLIEMADFDHDHDHTHRSMKSEVEILRQMDEPDPVLVTSDNFLYVLAPDRKHVKVLEIKDLHHVETIELAQEVESMVKNGFSLEGDQDHEHEHDH